MLAGADESAPYRPGRYLETPQSLGILPTWSFWNRRDVWRSARWFVAPVVGLTIGGTLALDVGLHVFWKAAIKVAIAAAVPVIQMGLLERYVRSVVRRRQGSLGDRGAGSTV
jgi:hypothetical protein